MRVEDRFECRKNISQSWPYLHKGHFTGNHSVSMSALITGPTRGCRNAYFSNYIDVTISPAAPAAGNMQHYRL